MARMSRGPWYSEKTAAVTLFHQGHPVSYFTFPFENFYCTCSSLCLNLIIVKSISLLSPHPWASAGLPGKG